MYVFNIVAIFSKRLPSAVGQFCGFINHGHGGPAVCLGKGALSPCLMKKSRITERARKCSSKTTIGGKSSSSLILTNDNPSLPVEEFSSPEIIKTCLCVSDPSC